MSNLLNASTSIDARPGLTTFGGGAVDPGASIVSRVLENGFAGAAEGRCAWTMPSSSDDSEAALSKGSFSRGIGVGGFAYTSSPIVEVESGIEGDAGGGDCTRTVFAVFFGGCASTFGRLETSSNGCGC